MTQGSSRGPAMALASTAAAALILVGVDLTLSTTENVARRPVHVAAVMIVPTLASLCAAVWIRSGLSERLAGRLDAADRHAQSLVLGAEDRLTGRLDDLSRRLGAVINGQVETRVQLAEATDDLSMPAGIAVLIQTAVDRALEARAARSVVVGRATVLPDSPAASGPVRRRRRRGGGSGIDPSTLSLMQRLDDELRSRGDDERQQDR